MTIKSIYVTLIVMLAISTLTAIVSVAASWLSLSRVLINTVTITQTFDLLGYQPVQLCPGDALTVTYKVKTSKVPSIINIYDNWRSVDLGYNVLLDVDGPVHSIISTPEDFTRVLTVTVPNVPPGAYEYVRAAQEDGAPVSVMSVPVKVLRCPPWQ